jgi:hypothetical protein
MPLIELQFFDRAVIRANPEWLFAYGDNLAGRGFGGQAKEARGEPNAVGIVTKRAPSMVDSAFLGDGDLRAVRYLWRQAFDRLNAHLFAGGVVVWPASGVGTGRAELKTRAPELWRELQLFVAGMKAVAYVAADADAQKKP